jgi:hypothetical protein
LNQAQWAPGDESAGADQVPTFADFTARRRSGGAEALAPAAVQWLASLPSNVRPKLLPIESARIANAFARKWANVDICLAYFDDLLIDRRGNRRGFPIGIILEIAALKDYFESVLHRSPQTVWDEVANRPRG